MSGYVITGYKLEIVLRASIPVERADALSAGDGSHKQAAALARWAAVTGCRDFTLVLAELAKDPDWTASIQVSENIGLAPSEPATAKGGVR